MLEDTWTLPHDLALALGASSWLLMLQTKCSSTKVGFLPWESAEIFVSRENEPCLAKMTQRDPGSHRPQAGFGAAQLRDLGSVLLRKLFLSCEKVRQLTASKVGKGKTECNG